MAPWSCRIRVREEREGGGGLRGKMWDHFKASDVVIFADIVIPKLKGRPQPGPTNLPDFSEATGSPWFFMRVYHLLSVLLSAVPFARLLYGYQLHYCAH